MSADLAIVSVIYGVLATLDAGIHDPQHPEAWTVQGEPLEPDQVAALRNAGPQEWKAVRSLAESDWEAEGLVPPWRRPPSGEAA